MSTHWTPAGRTRGLGNRAPVARARGGMVAAAHPVAAAAGAEILGSGGTAADAAVAASAALGVAEPFGSGIGGGGFFLIYDAASEEVAALDARETAPAATSPDMFLDPAGVPYLRETRETGGLAVGAPGLVRCWSEVVRRWGRMSLAEVLAPAVRVARSGFRVTPYFAQEIAAHRYRLEQFPESRRRFLARGAPLKVGSRFVQPDLAATLELLAARGADAFYATIAPEIAAVVGAPPTVSRPAFTIRPGRLSADDILGYRLAVRQPLHGQYRGYRVVTHTAPSSGPTLLETLNLLAGFDLSGPGPRAPASVHLVSEAQRVADADRSRWLGDPDAGSIPVQGLVSAAYADVRRRRIAPDRTPRASTPPGDPLPFQLERAPTAEGEPVAHGPPEEGQGAPSEAPAGGTSHLSMVDADGNAVAFTATLATHFGSAMLVPGRGFLLNDTLSDFHLDPNRGASNNLAGPGKRPRSSIAPTFLFDRQGHLRWVLGAAGGDWITPIVVQLVADLLDWGMAPQAAVDWERFRPANERGSMILEPELFDRHPRLVAGLRAIGHAVTPADDGQGGAQVIAADPVDGQLTGGADLRRDGAVAQPGQRPD